VTETVDAVVIGSGPNGLVGAILLADAGWDVLVLEEQPTPGGAVRTEELTEPGFRSDVMSAFYPLAAGSPVVDALGLTDHGLRWRHADLVVAHPATDGTCASLSRDLDETAASLDAFAPGDGDAWRELYRRWEHTGRHLVRGLFTPFPPVRALLGIVAAEGGPRGMLDFVRFGMLPARRLGEEVFDGEGGRRLLAGNALHADLTPDSAGGGLYGWVLCGLGQQHGWPVPEGGAGNLAKAMISRLEAAGGRVECGDAVTSVLTANGRAAGVRTAGGREVRARRAVLADVAAPALYDGLVDDAYVPRRLRDDLRRFQWDTSTVKVDWSLDGPIPWTHPDARRAGTVHVTESVQTLAVHATELANRERPTAPFCLVGQYAAYDPTRQPEGKECAWAYTHVPQGLDWDEASVGAFADLMEEQIEAVAPGFRALVRKRHVLAPGDLEARDRNLRHGAINQGTAQIHQQLVFRPTPGLARPETPLRGLYLASASAHPGGGVHGACGANAAKAALLHAAPLKRLGRS
jgi:phytoene dehydrogenase-like protein